MISCPEVQHDGSRSGYPAWVIIVAIVFIPVGLLALLAGAANKLRQLRLCLDVSRKFLHQRVNPSSLHSSLPTPWWTKNRSLGIVLRFHLL